MALRHDAFISYSHAVDGKLAAALEQGLEKLAKPLLKLRALDVFRDQTSLAASPALWPGILAHLEVSEWFLLLACPASAASIWCNKEASWWLEHRSANRMLVLLTEGDILWDPVKRDFDWARTTALPRILEGRCEDEPLYVDVRWARDSDLLSLRSAQFRDVVVNVAAPIRGVPKDELDGADLRQLARNRLLVRSGVAAITLAAGIAVWQAIVANQQKNEAERQRDIAIARQFAAQAELMRAQQPDRLPLALMMATESVRSQPESIEAQQTLRALVSQFPLPTTVLGHTSLVESAVFSPDMSQIATAAKDGALWNLTETTRIASLAGANHKVIFSPDGSRIAGCCAKVGVWDRTGAQQLLLSPADLQGEAENIAFSADGRLLAMGLRAAQPGFAIYDLASRQLLMRYGIKLSGYATAIAFAPDGTLYFGPRDKIEVHSGSPLEHRKDLDPQIGALDLLAVDPTGRYLVAGADRKVTVFDLTKETIVARLQVRGSGPGRIRQIAFDPSGRHLGAVGEHDVGAIWRVRDWSETAIPSHGEFQTIHSLSFDPSAPKAMTCGTDGSCSGWSLISGRKVHQFAHVYAFEGAQDSKRQMLSGTYGSAGSVVVTAGTDGTARTWLTSTPGEAGRGDCIFDEVLVRTFVSTGRSWSGELLDPVQRNCSAELAGKERTRDLKVSPTGSVAATSLPVDLVEVRDVRSGETMARLAHTDPVDWDAVRTMLRGRARGDRAVLSMIRTMQNVGSVSVRAVSSSGKRVATVRDADRKLRIWDTGTGRVAYSEGLPNGDPVLLEFLSDALLLRVDPSGLLSVQNLPRGEVAWSASAGKVTALALSPDTRRIATSSDSSTVKVQVRNATTGVTIFEQSSESKIGDLVFDRSGRYLVALGPESFVPSGLPQGVAATVWDTETNRVVLSVPKDEGIVAIAFAADGARFAIVGDKGDVKVWDLASGTIRRTVTADPGPVAFSTNGQWLALGNRSVRVLDMESLQPIAQLDIGGEIRDLEFRDGDALIAARRFDSGATKGSVELYRWKAADLLAEACRRMPAKAAESQWRQLLPEHRMPTPCANVTLVPHSNGVVTKN